MCYDTKYSEEQCIAKAKHLDVDNSRFLLNQEKTFLLSLKHQCVVRLLATSGNPTSPILLMERMWMSLAEFLTNKHSDHNKISILHDVACGLHYIHEKDIIHCDLTADNILLTDNITAKLANFGRAMFCQQSMKCFPETSDYLPPEIFEPYSKASCSTKVDVFSFGCLVIHTFTEQHPIPDFDKYVMTYEVGKYKRHSEIERRSVCLKKFNNNCKCITLQDIVLKCLQDDRDYRPTAVTLFSLLDKLPTANVPHSFKLGMFNITIGLVV